MAKTKFGIYVECTTLAKKLDKYDMYLGVHSVWVCRDTHDYWIAKVHENLNDEYESEEGTWLIERNKIDHEHIGSNSPTDLSRAIKLDLDDGCNWDNFQCDSYVNVIDVLSQSFGVVLEDGSKLDVEDGELVKSDA